MNHTAINTVDTVYSVFPEFGVKPQTVNVKQCIDNKKITGHHTIIPTDNTATTDITSLPEGHKAYCRLGNSVTTNRTRRTQCRKLHAGYYKLCYGVKRKCFCKTS